MTEMWTNGASSSFELTVYEWTHTVCAQICTVSLTAISSHNKIPNRPHSKFLQLWRTEPTSKSECWTFFRNFSVGGNRNLLITGFFWEVLPGWLHSLVLALQLSLLSLSSVSDDGLCFPNQRPPRHANPIVVQFIALLEINLLLFVRLRLPESPSWT